MRVMIREMDDGLAATQEGSARLREAIEPALARGEVVELDFEGVWTPSAAFLYGSIGTLVEQDPEDRVPGLLRYANISALDLSAVEGVIEFAIRRRENPRWAEGAGRAAEQLAERE